MLVNPSTSLRVNSVDEMHALAAKVAGDLKPGDVLLLEGELGSGKTTFVQGLAKALGVEEQVTSPTFAIVSGYETGGNDGVEKLIHVDLYRLGEEEAGPELFGDEMRQSAVTVIEWADRLRDKAPKEGKKIKFAHGATEKERVVTL